MRILIKDLHDHVGKEVTLKGWVQNRRDHGKLTFIDLRDFSGKVQCVFKADERNASDDAKAISDKHEEAKDFRAEWVVEIKGKIEKRPEKMANEEEPMGDLEVKVLDLKVINKAETPPIGVEDDGLEIGEEHRLKYRYIDLKRDRMRKNLKNRFTVMNLIRNELAGLNFTEVETPILSKSTPEGARDYVVPSRLYKGKFYALPQSPQQYKQLLMVSGLERYFQIARCFRDEDTRGDRQPEFTQLDVEMSFVEQDDILELIENLYTKIVQKIYPNKRIPKKPWPRLSYEEVMEEYGTDSPDLRENKKDPDELAFAWITGFPLFQKQTKDDFFRGAGGALAPSHHMFTSPHPDDVSFLDSKPEEVRGLQHDLVLNGYEIGGGSVRIHDPKIQEKVFDLIGFSEGDKANFSHILEAFKYGIPPHGGIAMGVDRFLMILEGESSIREVFAFPKTGEGRDLMMDAPSEIGEKEQKELGIEVEPPEEET